MLFLLSLIASAAARLLARSRDEGSKDIEILVLRHQLKVLRRQVGPPRLRPVDRALLAVAARALPRDRWASFCVTPQTLLHWHRELVRRKWSYSSKRTGRPPMDPNIRELICRMARENPRWGTVALVAPASVGETGAMRSHRYPHPCPAPRSAFAGYRFPPEGITLAVRWYLRFGLSYREELLAERGIEVD